MKEIVSLEGLGCINLISIPSLSPFYKTLLIILAILGWIILIPGPLRLISELLSQFIIESIPPKIP